MDEVGLLDERYFFFMEETDRELAMRKSGWKSCFIPDAMIFHFQGQCAGHNVNARMIFYTSRYKYLKNWHGKLLPIWAMVIFLRLLLNTILNLLGTVLTFGCHASKKSLCLDQPTVDEV